MKIMQIMAGAAEGGAETFFADLAIALHAAGLQQVVVTRPGAARVGRLRAAGLAVVEHRFPPFAPLVRLAMRRLIALHRPDVIQAWMGRAASLVPRTDIPTIGWFGGYYDLKRYRTCDYFVGVTRDIARHIVAAGAPAKRTRAIHTFAELDDAPAVDRAGLGTPAEVPLLLALARLHRKKGIDTLLQALVDVPEAWLWIAGEGPLRAELVALADRLGVKDRVRFLGWRDDRGALLRAADVCVFPSRYEPFGTVMVEAWQTGTPLVAAAAAGPKAYVEDGRNGLLVPIDDAAALAAAIRRVLADAGLRGAIVEGGRRTYEAEFTRERIVAAYLDLYREAASSFETGLRSSSG